MHNDVYMQDGYRLVRNLCVIVLVMGVIIAEPFVALARCPNCFFDADTINIEKNPDGTVKRSADGRPMVTWRLDRSWNSGPGEGMWDAANLAFGGMNTGRGNNNELLDVVFYRQLDTAPRATVTIIKVPKSKLGDACARTVPLPNGRFEIWLPPSTSEYNLLLIIDYIRHEILHALGLAHPTVADQREGCFSSLDPNRPDIPTAMGWPLFCGANQNNLKMTPNDLSAANAVQRGEKSNCNERSKPENLELGGGGGGGGNCSNVYSHTYSRFAYETYECESGVES